ncbi:MAG: alkaline phosphatase D family protein [Bacteroidota bacterium]
MYRITFFSTILFTIVFSFSAYSQFEGKLQSGPMVGGVDMLEATLWLQTKGEAEVYATYFSTDEESTVFKTDAVTTMKEDAYTAHLLADQVKPGKSYQYDMFIDGEKLSRPYPTTFKTPPLWQYRTDPPEMKILLGSCTFINEPEYDRPGKPYGGDYEIFEAMQKEQGDFMLWLGDNVYLREVDFGSRTGIYHRYTHTRANPEMQGLLASTANYAIWDDHDYGPNNSDRSYYMSPYTLEAFKDFWANPTYGIYQTPSTISSFAWGDATFFLLDNRSFRTPNDASGKHDLLGEEQMQWLLDALISCGTTFKFVCIGNQVLNSVERFENHINLAPEERTHILRTIAEENIQNVIFLTGDRHHSELSYIEKGKLNIYDFTVSPLTSGSYDASDEPNHFRVEGSHVGIRNYGIMKITGPRLERLLTMSLHDKEGKELWSYEIKAQYRGR